jgi:hypothetical protein
LAAADDLDDNEITMWQAERAVQLACRGDLTGPDMNEGPPDGADLQNPQEAGTLCRSREEMEGTLLNLLHLLPAAPFALEEARAWKLTPSISPPSRTQMRRNSCSYVSRPFDLPHTDAHMCTDNPPHAAPIYGVYCHAHMP